MTKKTETIEAPEIEVLNSSEDPEKITKVRAEENTSQDPQMDEFLKNSPLGKVLENMEELKKIRGFFLASLLLGFTGLFVFHLWFGLAAIIFGILDLRLGSKFTKKASYVGIIFGLLDLLILL